MPVLQEQKLAMSMDGLVENCSYIFDTSAIHGGRMSRDDSRDGGGRERLEQVLEDTTAGMQEVERSRSQSRGVRSDDVCI